MTLIQAIMNRSVTAATLIRLRWHKVAVGRRFFVLGPAPRLRLAGKLALGERVNLRCDVGRVVIDVGPQGSVTIGNRSFLNSGVQLVCEVAIEIGPHCRIGPFCCLSDTNNHAVHEHDTPITRPIKFGRNVWLGRSVIVLPGVSIGDNSVVGAGSVVAKSIPANEVWAGNPAMFVKPVRGSPDWIRR